ncbi:MAG TPA: bifunctional precorrin-2 dehydrogenase/sirohydrochlorin ferrochelatase [Methylomusa anaerophila]|nr:bifunctional precorrin-2 dehydrogenase/sirohydrochlorin ferrochelatase [Methylomusa anaerophila]HML89397.1 bifunctional precorrin-2 dehydrogenase/sirohydrochlorin ferrochelatase [Methylomusa anaerophila]
MNVKLQGRCCAVIGGGNVAERKTLSLLAAGAKVTVVSPALTEKLAGLARAGHITWIAREYTAGDVQNCFVVICATGDPAVNSQAAKEAREGGSLVNVADNPGLSDFHVPSAITRGDLMLTVSTAGKSPAMARRLKEELGGRYGPEYGRYLEIVAKVRREMKEQLPTSQDREQFWRDTFDENVLTLLRLGKMDEAEERIQNAVSSTGIKP